MVFIYTCQGSCAPEQTLCHIWHQLFRRRVLPIPSDFISKRYGTQERICFEKSSGQYPPVGPRRKASPLGFAMRRFSKFFNSPVFQPLDKHGHDGYGGVPGRCTHLTREYCGVLLTQWFLFFRGFESTQPARQLHQCCWRVALFY